MVQEASSALADAGAARDGGAEMVEFRVDQVFAGTGDEGEMREIARLCDASPLPVILTCRSESEGGFYGGDEDARIALYEYVGTGGAKGKLHPPRYLDLELASYERSANLRQKAHLAVDWPLRGRVDAPTLLLSMHDVKGRPGDLSRRVARLREAEAAGVVKVAYRARSLRDALEILELPGEVGRPAIALGMGEFGFMTRVLAPKFGGFLTFASLRGDSATAAGQPTLKELLGTYRMREIGAGTRVYGVIGWPVAQSLSPIVHNAAFLEMGVDAVYMPMPVAAGTSAEENDASFKATVLEMLEHPRLGFAGASVTAPFKESLVRLARSEGWAMDEAARGTGSGNTLVRDGGGVRVMNTDAPAFAACVPEGVRGAGGRAVVLGAGGVARSVAWSLGRMGKDVRVVGRNAARASGLAQDVSETLRGVEGAGQVEAKGVEEVTAGEVDVVVNGTPVGMRGGESSDGLPADEKWLEGLRPDGVVMETVYNPVETPLVKWALGRGMETVTGLEMFVGQAAMQFEAWTGRDGPRELMRARAVEGLRGEEGA